MKYLNFLNVILKNIKCRLNLLNLFNVKSSNYKMSIFKKKLLKS